MRKVPNLQQIVISIVAVSGIGIFLGAFAYNCLKTIFWIAKNPDHFEVIEEKGED